MSKNKTARERKEAQKRAAQFQEVSWDELERTSLLDSVFALLTQAENDHQEQIHAEQERRKAEEHALLLRRNSEARRERSRALFLVDQKRARELRLSIEAAKQEGRALGAVVKDTILEAEQARLAKAAEEQKLERAAAVGQEQRKKQKLQHFLVAAAVFGCISGAGATGAYLKTSENNQRDIAALQQLAVQTEKDALARVAALESELSKTSYAAEAEQGQLKEALRLAQIEAQAAHQEVLSFDPRRTAPKQLASKANTVSVASADKRSEKPNLSTAIKNAEVSTMAYDFGMSQDECDAHDPLCGNL